MRRCKIIAFSGFKSSGKDMVATLVQETCRQTYPDLTVKTIAFADPIKKVVQGLFDLNPDSTEQYDDFKRTNVSYQLPKHLSHSVSARHLVREIGMLMRSYDERQFIEYVLGIIKNEPDTVWLVTDLRFDNEYNALLQHGARFVNITRPGCVGDGHVTEQGLQHKAVDYNIDNSGSLSELMLKTKQLVKDIFKEWNV